MVRHVIQVCSDLLYHVKGVSALSIYCNSSAPPSASSNILGFSHKVQSSPGYLHVGQVPSNWTRQIPHTSSSGMSHRHDATAFHSLIVTFIRIGRAPGQAEKGSIRSKYCRLEA